MPNDNPTPEEIKAFEDANPQLRPPSLGSEKPLLAGMIALLVGSVTGVILAIRGFFSDPKK